ncbi:alpha/beta-hydrolase [Wallemia mellicola CBS 633.66]|uniref:Alpha/beta-hydrolase n=1 Tax=Wallemia mellicola (strain ATCC MYA-4683 / CBS 633.66) TaxID=671144 RepID=I4YBS2_WALMC|nr:alpha/beta-hydrolase [Wallemia mellicola CBS 633.66]EIM21414.1 alpha/beta-hydrolase [Wallemia mellicola CBS 633.66]|eukprot:XP_006958445.1 alpha/beta-hydrolase [Wallemia mellicola CBS 633.66]
MGVLSKAHKYLVWFGAAYVTVLISLVHPLVQQELLYLRNVRMVDESTLSNPAAFGLSPYSTLNVKLNTSDGEHLGAWQVLPKSLVKFDGSIEEQLIEDAFRSHLTVIFAHGNAATRAMQGRVATVNQLSTKLDANVIAFDYRGFGDSTGLPSEDGLTLDASAAYEYAISRGAVPENIVLLGQSLGTGVMSNFAKKLSDQGVRVRAVVLAAPFSSISKLLETYKIGGLFPLFSPMRSLPQIRDYLFTFLKHKYNTMENIQSISSAILIAHSKDDLEIPLDHSLSLFKSQPGEVATRTITTLTNQQWGVYNYINHPFKRAFLITENGGHNNVVSSEGFAEVVQNFITKV